MSVVGAVSERGDRPAYVRFVRKAVEDKAASLREGRYVAKDVDYALITPPYSKDCIEIKVQQWKANMDADVANGRLPAAWRDSYLQQHVAWLNGQELPPAGTAIRDWGMVSPAQKENLIRMNILTVEDLAGVNDEGLRRIGMGAMELKSKAVSWLQSVKDHGPLTMKMAALETENAGLKASIEKLTEQVTLMTRKLAEQVIVQPAAVVERTETSISADDILPESEPVNRKRK